MKFTGVLGFLVLVVVLTSLLATISAIFSHEGPGPYTYKSIRGQEVKIYGQGLYKDMSAEVAPQGLAQDHITLLIAVPLIVFSFLKARKGSLKARYLLTGTFGYFLVTYLFYLVMAMYNAMYPAYVILLSASFFGFYLSMQSFKLSSLPGSFRTGTPLKLAGGFLIFSSTSIALLWLSIIIPPLLNGSIVPKQVEHYTTLIVQGLDLGVLLPAGFISGMLLIRKEQQGYLLAPVYLVFLSLLMTALTAKVLAMNYLGYNVIPVIFIIPVFNLIAIFCMVIVLRQIREEPGES